MLHIQDCFETLVRTFIFPAQIVCVGGPRDKTNKKIHARLLELEIAYEREVQTLALAQEKAKVAQKTQASMTNRKKQRLQDKQWRTEALQERVQALKKAESTQLKLTEKRKTGHIDTFFEVRV